MTLKLLKMAARATLNARKAELAREEEKRQEEITRQSRIRELAIAKVDVLFPKVVPAIESAAEQGLSEVAFFIGEYEDTPNEEDKLVVRELIAILVSKGFAAREQIVTYPRSASDEMPERNILNVHISWQKK